MEVATPTEDCLILVYDLLCPIIKTRDEGSLDRQEVNHFLVKETTATHPKQYGVISVLPSMFFAGDRYGIVQLYTAYTT